MEKEWVGVNLTPDNVRRAGDCYIRLQYLGKEYRKTSNTVRDCKSRMVSILIGTMLGCLILSTLDKLGNLPLQVEITIMAVSVASSFVIREILYRGAAKRAEHIKEEVTALMINNQGYIRLIPQAYRYPLACNYIADVLQCGRAENLKEAMNLFEEQLHRWRLEQTINRVLVNQQRNNVALWAMVGTNIFFR